MHKGEFSILIGFDAARDPFPSIPSLGSGLTTAIVWLIALKTAHIHRKSQN